MYSESLAPAGEHSFEYDVGVLHLAYTIYASAQASGKLISTVTSQYIEVS